MYQNQRKLQPFRWFITQAQLPFLKIVLEIVSNSKFLQTIV